MAGRNASILGEVGRLSGVEVTALPWFQLAVALAENALTMGHVGPWGWFFEMPCKYSSCLRSEAQPILSCAGSGHAYVNFEKPWVLKSQACLVMADRRETNSVVLSRMMCGVSWGNQRYPPALPQDCLIRAPRRSFSALLISTHSCGSTQQQSTAKHASKMAHAPADENRLK